MPNAFAYIALFAWPVVVFILYRRLPRANALVASILGGYLLLPYGVGINPPVLPTYDKTLAPALAALLMSILMRPVPDHPALATERGAAPAAKRGGFTRQRATVAARSGAKKPVQPEKAARPRQSRVGDALILLLIVTPFFTVINNGAPIDIGPRVLPGMRLYDAFSMVLNSLVAILPYLLARRYLATPAAHRVLLRGLVLWGVFYTLPALYEIRMSPQLARTFYGFLSQSFAQAIRDGGYRPVVFLQHGLWLAIFFTVAILSAASLWRALRQEASRDAGRWMLALLYLTAVLLLCHSLGAAIILAMLLPLALFLRGTQQLFLASLIALVTLTYPALRGADLIPVDKVLSMTKSYSGARAQSLEVRLRNEGQLLTNAREKPVAGWGGYGRGRIYDPRTGRDLSITDGEWIIIVVTEGWLGYIAHFGLLTAPILMLTLRRRKLTPDLATTGLSLVLVANLCDMIPNATLTPVTWMIAGALMGRVAQPPHEENAEEEKRRLSQGLMHRPKARLALSG